MRRYKISKDRGKFHSLVIATTMLVLVSLLIRSITLSFSTESGQANNNLGTIIMSNLSVHIMESGSSLLRYGAREEVLGDSLSVSILSDQLALHEFTRKEKPLSTLLQNPEAYGLPEAVPDTGIGRTDMKLKPIETMNYEEEDEISNTKDERNLPYYEIVEGSISKEYILTNGVAFNERTFNEYIASKSQVGYNVTGQLSVGVLDGELIFDETTDYSKEGEGSAIDTFGNNVRINYTLEQLKDVNFLVQNFYIVDSDTSVYDGLFDAEAMLGKDMTLKQGNEAPQILIYHTHSQEAFVDSRAGVTEDTIVGIGTYLTEILQEQYGYNVIHDTSVYDLVNGVEDRNKAYNYAEDGITKILEENPTIEVVIDLHRDGMPKRSTMIDGQETARIMLFNGLSRDLEGPISYLENPYLQDNLAFGLQLHLEANEKYPGLFYKNYLKSYRYNLHVRQKSILIELGTHKNTVQSARNAMEPFAEVLDTVLKGK